MQHAVGVLESGLCNYVVLSYGHNAFSSDSMRRMLMERGADDPVFGHFGAAAGYALGCTESHAYLPHRPRDMETHRCRDRENGPT